jgi:hypothetical protein
MIIINYGFVLGAALGIIIGSKGKKHKGSLKQGQQAKDPSIVAHVTAAARLLKSPLSPAVPMSATR